MVTSALDDIFSNLGSTYWFNWTEELYRQALLAYGTSTEGSYYDEELLAEWRNIFDPTSTMDNKGIESFEKEWKDHYGEEETPWYGYKVDVLIAPEKLRYWLDIIDTTANVGQYSVNRIGRRTKVTENSKINEVFSQEINDIVFIENTSQESESERLRILENIQYYISIG